MDCSTPGFSVLHHFPEFAQMPSVLLGKIPPEFCWFSITTFSPITLFLACYIFPLRPIFLFFIPTHDRDIYCPMNTSMGLPVFQHSCSKVVPCELFGSWTLSGSNRSLLSRSIWKPVHDPSALFSLPQWVGSYWMKWLPPKMGIITGTWGG